MDKDEVDYEEWIENVAQSIAILLNCMRPPDRARILNKVEEILNAQDEAREKRLQQERRQAERPH